MDPRFAPNYDPEAVAPMRQELVAVGLKELLTGDDVHRVVGSKKGTVLVVVNSVCGCAAGNARPGVMMALQNGVIPDEITTVFAGQDKEAVMVARGYFKGFGPSSPCIALLKDGEVVCMLERLKIEGRTAEQVAADLVEAFDKHCTRPGPSVPRDVFEKVVPFQACGSSIPRFV